MTGGQRRCLALIGVLSVATLALLWFTSLPLGIPGEWEWQRIPLDGAEALVLWNVVGALVVGAVYCLIAWLGLRRMPYARPAETAGWLSLAMLSGWWWLLAVQETPPAPWQLSKAPFVTWYPGISGYFHAALNDVEDIPSFLAGYEDLVAQGDSLHQGTHPPGLIVLHRMAITSMQRWPALAELLNNTEPPSIREACEIIRANNVRTGRPFDRAAEAALWLATIVTQTSCVATIVPLFLLLSRLSNRTIAWQAAVLWPLIPAAAIFLPKSDVLFTGPGLLLLWLWLNAAGSSCGGEVAHQTANGPSAGRRMLLGGMAGCVGWCGLCLSLAFLPLGLIAVLGTGLQSLCCSSADRWGLRIQDAVRRMAAPAIGGLAAFVLLTGLAWLLTDVNLPEVWLQNYRNHAGFYAEFHRTTWLWLLVNPFELCMAVGAPIAVLAAIGSGRALQATMADGLAMTRRESPDPNDRTAESKPAVAAGPAVSLELAAWISGIVVGWGLLWVSGKNSGEAARLWIPLMPLTLVAAATVFARQPASASVAGRSRLRQSERREDVDASDRLWGIVVVLQLLVCTLTVLRVTGFHFDV